MKAIEGLATGGEGTFNVREREEERGRGMITGLTKGIRKAIRETGGKDIKVGKENTNTMGITALVRTRSNCKRQTRPLARESAPYQQTRNCLTVIRLWL
jgi:VIT1/CCC1 family predicted Fe2+/Mn2+ transporter